MNLGVFLRKNANSPDCCYPFCWLSLIWQLIYGTNVTMIFRWNGHEMFFFSSVFVFNVRSYKTNNDSDGYLYVIIHLVLYEQVSNNANWAFQYQFEQLQQKWLNINILIHIQIHHYEWTLILNKIQYWNLWSNKEIF